MKRLLVILLIALFAAPLGAQTTAPADEPNEIRLTLLHVNDVHGRTMTHRRAGRIVGSYARLATLVKRIRREAGDPNRVLLVDAGDTFSRGDRITRATKGQANIELMNRIGFDAWTPGNGGFYLTLPVLRQRIEQAKFPVLTTNVLLAESDRPLGKRRLLRQVGPIQVGLLGLCTVYADNRAGLTVNGALPAAQQGAQALRRDGADVVIALSHLGYPPDKLLAAATSGIDVIVGGHTHTVLSEGDLVTLGRGQTLIVQAGAHLRYLGRVDLKLRPDASGTWRIVDRKAKLIPIDQDVPMDPAIRRRLAELARKHRASRENEKTKPRARP